MRLLGIVMLSLVSFLPSCKQRSQTSGAQSTLIKSGDNESTFLFLSTDLTMVCMQHCDFSVESAGGKSTSEIQSSCELEKAMPKADFDKLDVSRKDLLAKISANLSSSTVALSWGKDVPALLAEIA